jgi:type 1 glutamine amidotransferase
MRKNGREAQKGTRRRFVVCLSFGSDLAVPTLELRDRCAAEKELGNRSAPDTTNRMKLMRVLLACGFACLLMSAFPASAAEATGKIRVLVVTGGHDFEVEPFFKVFKDNPDITFQAVEHPKAHALLKAEAAKAYDVLVLYDMYQDISDEAKADFLARLKKGEGLVVLHHAIASYQKWPEYSKIIGAHYYLEKAVVDGVEKPQSILEHGVHFKLHMTDPAHPVTSGIKDFEIHDETYNLFDVAKDCHPLVTTDEPKSNKIIGWAKTYGPARVVYLQSGHDHFAYENPSFRQMLQQAIRWTAQRN